MKKKILKRLLFLIVVVVSSILGIFLGSQYKANQLPYGKKANPQRIKMQIPTIKTTMYSGNVSDRLGNTWENIRQKPKEDEILHVWKTVIPNEKYELDKEKDGFRKLDENGEIIQLNLTTIIKQGKIVEQRGKEFKSGSSYNERVVITGEELNRLLKTWEIY